MLDRHSSATRRTSALQIERSDGNLFADLELHNSIVLDARIRLAVVINEWIAAPNLTRTRSAGMQRVNHSTNSARDNYRLDGFSVERLKTNLITLGTDRIFQPRSKKRSIA